MNRIARGLLATAAALSLAAAAAAPASAAANAAPNRDRYAALGDSFAAGVGGVPLRDAGTSLRSADAYPVALAGRLSKVTFLAASGADTLSVLQNQVAAVPATAQQVTLTVGGNDGGAFGQVAQCLSGSESACAVAPVDPSSPTAQAQVAGIAGLIGAIQLRAPQAHIYVTGYPQLLDTNVAVVNGVPAPTCTIAGTDVGPLAYAVDQAIDGLNGRIASAVGVAHSGGAKAEFVPVSFAGHGLCDGSDSWVYGPGASAPLHPNAAGQQAYADAVAGAGFVEGR